MALAERPRFHRLRVYRGKGLLVDVLAPEKEPRSWFSWPVDAALVDGLVEDGWLVLPARGWLAVP